MVLGFPAGLGGSVGLACGHIWYHTFQMAAWHGSSRWPVTIYGTIRWELVTIYGNIRRDHIWYHTFDISTHK